MPTPKSEGRVTLTVKIEWENAKDEMYCYFGKCRCGNGSVMQGSKFCSECGKKIKNPMK